MYYDMDVGIQCMGNGHGLCISIPLIPLIHDMRSVESVPWLLLQMAEYAIKVAQCSTVSASHMPTHFLTKTNKQASTSLAG